MRSKIFCTFLGMALGWAGSAIATSDPPKPQGTVPAPPYVENRRIGLLRKGGGVCPTIDGWQGAKLLARAHNLDQENQDQGEDTAAQSQLNFPLFERGAEEHREEFKELRKLENIGLDRFCVYTNDDPSNSKKFPDDDALPPGLVKVERDRMALTTMATTNPALGAIGDQAWQSLSGRFLAQVGRVQLRPAENRGVRLVFLDTHPTGQKVPENTPVPISWHGYSMAHLAHRLVCGEDQSKPCAIEIDTRLALRHPGYKEDMPFPPSDPGSEEGGRVGLVGELAEAIIAEVDQWRKLEPGKRPKLILNLSVGWDGELHNEGETPDLKARKVSKMELPTQAVYKALRYAAKHGVLVIAAAGNRRGGTTKSQWPLLPAAWELRRPSWLPFLLGPKRVYAVGGVDWQGLPLPNTRVGGLPRRVAYGDHAVARTKDILDVETPGTTDDSGDEATMIYTGTSVSTAVASSIAAVVWHLRPNLAPAQVMRLIGRSSTTLDSRADFYSWKHLSSSMGRPNLRQMSLCQTVLQICGPDGRRCTALKALDCQLWEHLPADLSLLQTDHSKSFPFSQVELPSTCGPGVLFVKSRSTGRALSALDVCPMKVLPDAGTPSAVCPQPGANPCPSCTLVPDPPGGGPPDGVGRMLLASSRTYALAAAIDPNWREDAGDLGASIASAVLTIDCRGSESVRFDLGEELIALDTAARNNTGPRSAKVFLGPIPGSPRVTDCTASLDYKINKTTPISEEVSAQSPVYVDP